MTRYTRGLRLLPAFALILTLFHPRDAAAAFDTLADSLRETVSDFVNDLFPSLTESTVASVTKVTPKSLVHGMDGGSHFLQHLSDAGYQLAEIDMSVGLIPDIKLTFQIVRELSEADRNALERSLEIDDKRVPGVTAMAQRQIIRTLLAVSKSEEMRVGKLVIGILPLPSADFTIEPADAPLGEEHSALYRAIKTKRGADPRRPSKRVALAPTPGGAPPSDRAAPILVPPAATPTRIERTPHRRSAGFRNRRRTDSSASKSPGIPTSSRLPPGST